MIKKKNILVAIAFMCIAFTSANAASLNQIDIKKTSDSAVDVTFYTTGSASSPIVTRKSNNKYVVMMPNVAGQNAGTPNLGSVKDIITNVDVKNVDDGMNGYTKVTFITTKPINIKTHMQQSAPLSQEEKEAKALIAQVKTHPKQTVAPTNPAKTVAKTTVTSSVATPSTSAKKTEPVKKETTQQAKTSNTIKQFTEVKPKAQTKKVSESGSDLESPVKKLLDSIPDSSATVPTSVPVLDEDAASFNTKDLDKIEEVSKTKSKKAVKTEKAQKTPSNGSNKAGWLFLLIPIWLLHIMSKAIRNSVQKSMALNASFKENLSEKPCVPENYDDLINDKEINWQERYKKFVSESKNEIKERNYTFISRVKPANETVTSDKLSSVKNSDIELSEVDKKRIQLENTLSKTPEIYSQPKIDISKEPVSEVKSEDEAIITDLHSLKLKAFAKPVSLHETNRNKVRESLPPTRKIKEGRLVNLVQSPLNKSTRVFKDAALSVNDLINTGNKYLQESSSNLNTQPYVMSSIDEYFGLLDKEAQKKAAKPDLSGKVAASLANVKPSMQLRKDAAKRVASNPIANQNKTSDYLNGLIVKSGFNIDENKGFYIVSLDGVYALIGRIKDEVFVLHKFDKEVDKIHVRHDSENVYMVKAGEFRSLIDVGEDKMGVLIEL